MKRLFTLILIIALSYIHSFSQVPDFLGIRLSDNFSTWKSNLLQKGFKIIPDRTIEEEPSTLMSNMYFQGKYNEYDCLISIVHEFEGESVYFIVVNVDCKEIDNLNKLFESTLNDYLRNYSKYKVEYEENSVSFNYDEENDNIVDLSLGLSKRYETLTINDVEMTNVFQVTFFNLKGMALQMIVNAYKNIEPPTVLGIEFGCDKATVISVLRERFGYSNVSDNNGIIEVENPSLGGFKFKYATFEFQYDKGKTYLSSADFQTNYTLGQESTAKSERDYLLSLMKPKYENSIESYTNEDGFKCYRFGANPKDISRSLGLIRLQKGQGLDGVKRLYLHLSYGPINYIDPSSDF